jgi:hypothetical protein
MPMAMAGVSSGEGGRVLACRSFWKAGAYEAPAALTHDLQGSPPPRIRLLSCCFFLMQISPIIRRIHLEF